MNAVIYARFSSSSQTEQSIEGQLKACHDYAHTHGMTVIGEYIDRAKSGTSADKRDEFQKMIKDSSRKQFEVVLVYQLDRFARSRHDSAITKAKLKRNGVRVVSARESINEDASGIILESVLEGIAEYYSVELAQKIKRGLDINAEKRMVIGPIPFGYKSVDRKYVINDDEAGYVKKIFQMYLDGETMADIAHYMNGLGFTTKRGNGFSVSLISKMLSNQKYCGYYMYKDVVTKDGIPAIVSEETFNEVAKRMEDNKKRPAASKAVDERYLLTTKLFCGHCESSMMGTSGTSKNGRLHQYYGCPSSFRSPKKCDKKSAKKQYIEDIVIQHCYQMLTDDNIKRIADEVMKLADSEKDRSHITVLEKSLKSLEAQKKNLIASLKVGQGNESFQKMILEQFEGIELQQAEVQKDILKESNLQNSLTYDQIMFFLNHLKNGNINDFKYRQMLVDVLVNKIYLYDDRVKIVFTTQYETVDVDVNFIDDLCSDLVDSAPLRSAPPKTSRRLASGRFAFRDTSKPVCGSCRRRVFSFLVVIFRGYCGHLHLLFMIWTQGVHILPL